MSYASSDHNCNSFQDTQSSNYHENNQRKKDMEDRSTILNESIDEEDSQQYQQIDTNCIYIPNYVEAQYDDITSIRKMHEGLQDLNQERKNFDFCDIDMFSLFCNYKSEINFHKAVKYCIWTCPKGRNEYFFHLLKNNRKVFIIFKNEQNIFGIAQCLSFQNRQSFGLWDHNYWFNFLNIKWYFLGNIDYNNKDEIDFEKTFNLMQNNANMSQLFQDFYEKDKQEKIMRQIRSIKRNMINMSLCHQIQKLTKYILKNEAWNQNSSLTCYTGNLIVDLVLDKKQSCSANAKSAKGIVKKMFSFLGSQYQKEQYFFDLKMQQEQVEGFQLQNKNNIYQQIVDIYQSLVHSFKMVEQVYLHYKQSFISPFMQDSSQVEEQQIIEQKQQSQQVEEELQKEKHICKNAQLKSTKNWDSIYQQMIDNHIKIRIDPSRFIKYNKKNNPNEIVRQEGDNQHKYNKKNNPNEIVRQEGEQKQQQQYEEDIQYVANLIQLQFEQFNQIQLNQVAIPNDMFQYDMLSLLLFRFQKLEDSLNFIINPKQYHFKENYISELYQEACLLSQNFQELKLQESRQYKSQQQQHQQQQYESPQRKK